VNYLLDTCALIKAAVQGERGLGTRARRVMRDQRSGLLISAVSFAELYYLVLRGRIEMTAKHVEQAMDDLKVEVIPFSERHALRCLDFPFPPKDPIDRMIIATALAENMPVISSDAVFRLCGGLEVIWN